MIREIKKEELRKMHDREGLILQGCGGELKEWVDGINETLEQEGILPKAKRLDDVAVFRNEGMTNLLFFFGEEKLDIGKLAVWRLQTHPQFGGTWMSDYVNNQLGGFLREDAAEKPNCAKKAPSTSHLHLRRNPNPLWSAIQRTGTHQNNPCPRIAKPREAGINSSVNRPLLPTFL